MFISILKKDLKRKKTMNLILLLFIILSAMFAASSVNNILSVVKGLDNYLYKAGISDFSLAITGADNDEAVRAALDKSSSVKGYRYENILFGSKDNILRSGKKFMKFDNGAIFMSIDDAKLNYFDENDDVIEEVEKGKVYIGALVADNSHLEIGDKLEIVFNDSKIEVEFAGILKDAFLGSNIANNPRFLLNESDYRILNEDSETVDKYFASMYYIDSDDVTQLQKDIADINGIMYSGDRAMIKLTYFVSILVAAIVLVMSIALLLISFVVLRFSIGFTLEEEFREIGVMKALGLNNSSIRGLYIVKYLAIALIGAGIGLVVSIPFGNMLLRSVSRNMVLANDNSIIISIICCAAVVAMILAFCWKCTGKVKKLSPIDAVRSGQTGERYKTKTVLNLGKSRLRPTSFLSLNDVLSTPKRYALITLVFTLNILMVMILANTANTLNSDKLLPILSVTKSDAYYSNPDGSSDIMSGRKTVDEYCEEIESKLEENGMPAQVKMEQWFRASAETENTKMNFAVLYCKDTDTSDYVYTKGTAPQNAHEFALTQSIADDLGIGIGDTIDLTLGENTDEYLLTAIFSSMDQAGQVGRLHQDVDTTGMQMSNSFAAQIDFDDDPDDKEIADRIERMKDIFGTESIFDAKDFVDSCTKSADTVISVKNLLLVISMVVLAMICVMLERSFISKECSEIALMKAIGIKNNKVIGQHVLRFVISGIIAAALSCTLCMPLTKIVIDPMFALIGADCGLEYQLRPLEVFGLYPAAFIAIMIISVFFTSLYTVKITASRTADIE